jgi:DeoR/GlpR family transcriptional regulator of sugar metabolism
MEVAAEVILLADHSKFGHAAGSIVGPITLIDRIITDTGISEEFEEGIHEIGIQVDKVEASV